MKNLFLQSEPNITEEQISIAFIFSTVIKNDIALIKLKKPVPQKKMECLKMNENDQQINSKGRLRIM